MRLALEVSPTRLLHGDTNPGNVLDGGPRGLVAIDPTPCLGEPSTSSSGEIDRRRRERAMPGARTADRCALGSAAAWCIAFAGMCALEAAEDGIGPPGRIDAMVELAGRSVEAASG